MDARLGEHYRKGKADNTQSTIKEIGGAMLQL